jgi:DNA invertase Pin-like site-specific DNA recombinase
MLIGYGRVSTHDQNLDLQRDALEAAGCERVIVDRMSGAASARPGLVQLKDVLRGGDTLVVWRLDRLGRSLKDLIAWVGYLDAQEIGLRSLHEAIDTTTPTGKLTFHIFGARAEFERTLIRDRTQAGLAAARARGRTGGRRLALNADKRALVVRLYNERQTPISRICAMMGISKPTLYSYVRAANGITEGPTAK